MEKNWRNFGRMRGKRERRIRSGTVVSVLLDICTALLAAEPECQDKLKKDL